MPAFDLFEPPEWEAGRNYEFNKSKKPSEAMKETGSIVAADRAVMNATGVESGLGVPIAAVDAVTAGLGTILGWFGADEAEPYIPEAGVDALA